jgi:hypothetical protein
MNVGMLIGSMGNLAPTRGFSILKLSKTATKQLTLMMIATVGFHSGVAGTVVAAARKIDEIKFLSPYGKINLNQKDYRVRKTKKEENYKLFP